MACSLVHLFATDNKMKLWKQTRSIKKIRSERQRKATRQMKRERESWGSKKH